MSKKGPNFLCLRGPILKFTYSTKSDNLAKTEFLGVFSDLTCLQDHFASALFLQMHPMTFLV